RALGHCGGTDVDIADGITWASGGEVPGVPTNHNPAKVINLSLGGPSNYCPITYQRAIDAAVSRGSTVVVAAGNEAM
ncbi:S8 family serine peptidase, partial [Escherichia coli]